MTEPKVSINGTTLTEAQAMTVRVAITDFLSHMATDCALGEDETGEGIRQGYAARSREIVHLMQSPPPETHVAAWQDISTAPKNTKVLVAYRNELGNWRIVTACYHTELPWSDEYGDHEEEFAPEAWYEESDSSEVIYLTSRHPTHWQPLPAPPATTEGSADANS